MLLRCLRMVRRVCSFGWRTRTEKNTVRFSRLSLTPLAAGRETKKIKRNRLWTHFETVLQEVLGFRQLRLKHSELMMTLEQSERALGGLLLAL